MSVPRIPFISLTPGEDAEAVHDAINRVVERGWFVLGPEVEQFEAQFAQAMGGNVGIGRSSAGMTFFVDLLRSRQMSLL